METTDRLDKAFCVIGLKEKTMRVATAKTTLDSQSLMRYGLRVPMNREEAIFFIAHDCALTKLTYLDAAYVHDIMRKAGELAQFEKTSDTTCQIIEYKTFHKALSRYYDIKLHEIPEIETTERETYKQRKLKFELRKELKEKELKEKIMEKTKEKERKEKLMKKIKEKERKAKRSKKYK